MGGFYSYLLFKSSSILCRCPVGMNILDPLTAAPKTQNYDFLKNGSDDFDRLSIIYGNYLHKYICIAGTF
jgi:hypothetical protein